MLWFKITDVVFFKTVEKIALLTLYNCLLVNTKMYSFDYEPPITFRDNKLHLRVNLTYGLIEIENLGFF